jgi:hypothetical protein
MGNDIPKNQLKQWEDITEYRRMCEYYVLIYIFIVSKKDIARYRKIWLEMFGTGEMDKEGFRRWIKAIGIFPNFNSPDAPIDHVRFSSFYSHLSCSVRMIETEAVLSRSRNLFYILVLQHQHKQNKIRKKL